jgi:tetratricopeptide (TPR) repeat protein
MKKREKEVEAYRKALELRPNSNEAHYYLGTWYEDGKQFEAAVTEYRTALTLDPKNEQAWFDFGELQLILGRRSDAMEAYRRLEKLNPGLSLRLKSLLELTEQRGLKSGQPR